MLYVVIAICTLYAVWQILKYFDVFATSSGTSGLKQDIRNSKGEKRSRQKEIRKLGLYTSITNTFRHIVLSDSAYQERKYYIERLELRSEVLDRMLTPEEVEGKNLLRAIIGIALIPAGVFYPIFWVGSVILVAIYLSYPSRLKGRIHDEDLIIDTYFIDLYLLMYSKLRMGSKARLHTVIESYIDTLQVSSNAEMRDVMLKFARFFLNNLTMYEDHEAVPKLRERYRSATIINFCNVATQALQGIDNADTLLTLKQDLVRHKVDRMKKKSEALRIKGERAIYLIYVILLIFIIVGWYSKLPLDFF